MNVFMYIYINKKNKSSFLVNKNLFDENLYDIIRHSLLGNWRSGDDPFRGTGHVGACKIYPYTRVIPLEFKHHILNSHLILIRRQRGRVYCMIERIESMTDTEKSLRW